MDVDKMQKINKLAKELFQHGMVPDLEEGTKQAEQMLNKDDQSISDVMKLGERPVQGRAPSPSFDVEREEDVNMQFRDLRNKVNEQARTIKALADQLNSIKEEMGKLKGMRDARPVMMKEPQQPQTHLRKEDVKKDEPHPKVGNYDPSDISIEEFFYSGPPK